MGTPKEGGAEGAAAPAASVQDMAFSAFSRLGKATAEATTVLKEKVGTPNILSEFNKEQEKFIQGKSKYGNLSYKQETFRDMTK